MKHPEWQFDELKCVGVDYTSPEQVKAYDAMHRKFRNYREEAERIISLLGLGSESSVIDMGCGTGAFALNVAESCGNVYAVDISEAMLRHCRCEADEKGLTNIRFCRGGFLTYEHDGDPVDAVVSVAVLHHLPDYWKGVGLRRIAKLLKTGGKFFLFDVVLPVLNDTSGDQMDAWVESIRQQSGDRLAAEAATHLRDEFSTYDWVMEGLLERSGFRIDTKQYDTGFRTTYVCTRP